VDGRIVKLLADTGASRSILPVEYLVDNKNLKPFTKEAVDFNNSASKFVARANEN
jgi:hypothetical protein